MCSSSLRTTTISGLSTLNRYGSGPVAVAVSRLLPIIYRSRFVSTVHRIALAGRRGLVSAVSCLVLVVGHGVGVSYRLEVVGRWLECIKSPCGSVLKVELEKEGQVTEKKDGAKPVKNAYIHGIV